METEKAHRALTTRGLGGSLTLFTTSLTIFLTAYSARSLLAVREARLFPRIFSGLEEQDGHSTGQRGRVTGRTLILASAADIQ